ncbi:eCIS core domain-containing protein [Saccharothrix sp. NRRL B-16348]|uniref:eCIS core domain-containing protein n=1 Tax=Saccharothrix sp. NRRL B-16348 TaxID=1415542 RepID=UPI0006B011A6|nr:DUF4157 domain-containing protein [Saccharothrix sp. NRRL B-16348]
MRAQDQEPVGTSRTQPTRAADPAPMSWDPAMPLTPQAIANLQRTIGNAATGRHIEARQRQPHFHEDGSAHLRPVQRSAVPEVLRSPGRPLDDDTRTEMENRLGADFSEVRLHTDAAARASAAEVGARAYTSGHHIVTGTASVDKHTLAHELTHVIQQRRGPVAGADNGDGLRISDPGDRFEREAEATARRALSGADPAKAAGSSQGSGAGTPAVQRMPLETPAQWWLAFDGSGFSWRSDAVDPVLLREALPAEREYAANSTAHHLEAGYASPDDVPVYVVRRFRQTVASGADDRDAGLRAGDRVARLTHRAAAEGGSPHVASTVLPDGSLGLAGNTGRAHVTSNDAVEMDEALREPISAEDDNRRQTKDAVKFGATVSGDYGSAHPESASLPGWTAAIRDARANGARYFELDQGGSGSQHAELTLLGQHVENWQSGNARNVPAEIQLGGVKMSCAACQWAFEATNRHIVPIGYTVVASGSHGQPFNGWIMPKWLEANPAAKKEVEERAKPAGGYFEENADGYRVLYFDEEVDNAVHGPPHSDSEWEESDTRGNPLP